MSKKLINVKRPTDALTENLQDAKRASQSAEPQAEVQTREIQHAEGSAKGLAEHGERLRPEGTAYIASFVVHIYKQRSNEDSVMLTASTGVSAVPEALAMLGLKELTKHLMTKYGRKIPRARGEERAEFSDREETPASKLILPEHLKKTTH